MKSFFQVFFLLFFVANCLAQTEHKRIVDRVGNINLSSVATGHYIAIDVTSGNSYCCEIQQPAGTIKFSSSSVNIGSVAGGQTITGRLAGNDEPQLASSDARICFVVPTNLETPTASMTMTSTAGTVNNVPAQCYETTLFGSFNTSVTDFNFLELTNTLTKIQSADNKTITGKIIAINTVPNPDTTVINNLAFTVQPGSRLDVNIHQSAGTGAFGPIKVAHNAAPGALRGIVSQYNITSSNPLDFVPVLQDVLQTRTNLAGARK